MLEIRKIIAEYDAIDHTRENVALASVVHVEESSYRRVGARMLVRSTGQWVGGISGGCLEGHALKKAQQAIFNNKPSLVSYDTVEGDSQEIGSGLGCHGRIEVLFTPIDSTDPDNEIEQLRRISKAESPLLLLKVIAAPETPEALGSILSINPINRTFDFWGLQQAALSEAIDITIQKKKSQIVNLESSTYGDLRILVEFIRPEIRIVIVGDNYDVHSMLCVADNMGWEIYVVGQGKKLSKEIFQKAKHVLPYNKVDQIKIHDYTAVILMAHDYARDKKMLKYFIGQSPKYLGLLGPKARFLKMTSEMPDVNFDDLHFVHSPTGLEIGAETPEEIALSVAAEIIATFRNKKGGSLRLKSGSIHARE